MLSAAAVSVDGFRYGLGTPLTAFLIAVLGSALGLRCTVRALALPSPERAGWLSLGAVAIGAGVFTMHAVALLGYTARGVHIGYDVFTTYASLGVVVLVAGVGVFVAGYRECTPQRVLAGGVITGLGYVAMLCLGVVGMQMTAEVVFDPALVALTVLIAVVAATSALWFMTTVHMLGAALGAALFMGAVLTGMDYTAMEAMTLLDRAPDAFAGGTSAVGTLLPVLVGPVLLLLFVALFLGLDPLMERDRRQEWGSRPGERTGEKLEWTPFEHR